MKFPDGYWPKNMTASEQSKSIKDFARDIYPIWKGIEERDVAADEKRTVAEVCTPGQVMFEVQTTHRQDLAIHAKGIKPWRDSVEMQTMLALRAKAARASAH